MTLGVTDAERRRVEHIDQLVVLGADSVPELLVLLGDPSWTVRRGVVGALAALGDDAVASLVTWLSETRTSEPAIAAAVDALAASTGTTATAAVGGLLGHPEPAVASDAAQILGRRKAVEATPDLVRALAHPDDNVAVAAIEALGAIADNRAVDSLIATLRSDSFFRRFAALQILARTSDPRVVAPLAELLTDDAYRIEAARALGRTGYVQAIAPLASLLARGGDPIIRLVALALADLATRAEWNGSGDHVDATLRDAVRPATARFVAALRTAEPLERAAIATVLGRIGETSLLPELSRLLEDDEAVKAAATSAILRIGRAHDEALVAALAAAPAARAMLLQAVRSPHAAEAVRALLADEDPEMRALACDALARIADTDSVPALFEALADPSPRVAHAATAAIHSLGVPDTCARTVVALRTGSPAVRRHALRILTYMGFPEAFEAILEAIDDPDSRIAELAVGGLAALERSPNIDQTLARLATDARDGVRAATMRAFGHRGGVVAVELLSRGLADAAAWVRYYACQGLGRTGDAAVTPLIVGRLVDPTPHVRIAAIEALGHLDTPAAWDALCSAVQSEDPDERRTALASMALRPRDQALPYLLDATSSADLALRLIALSGLGRRSEPAAFAALATAMRSADPESRDAALSLLADSHDARAAAVLVEAALSSDLDHPVHLALSHAAPARIAAIAERLNAVDDHGAGLLVAALARMRDPVATTALFGAAALSNPAARRAAAAALVSIGAEGARTVVERLAVDDPDPEVRRISAAAIAG
ncbi:MAG: HEAT repeat domain-containing protein [Kofleriaceae bacterium]